MLHPIWLTFLDENFEVEYQKEKFTFMLRFFYTTISILVLSGVVFSLYYALQAKYMYCVFGMVLVLWCFVYVIIVAKINQKWSIPLMFWTNMITSFIPVTQYFLNIAYPPIYQTGFLQGSAMMIINIALMIQPKFILNIIQLLLIMTAKMFLNFLDGFDLNIIFLIFGCTYYGYSLYEQEKKQRELFIFRREQYAYNELINETIDYPIMIIGFDPNEVRFNLLSSNKYSRTELKLINDCSLKYLMRQLRVGIKVSFETWISKKIQQFEQFPESYSINVQFLNKRQDQEYLCHVKQISNRPKIFVVILKKKQQDFGKQKQMIFKYMQYLRKQFLIIGKQKIEQLHSLKRLYYSFTCVSINTFSKMRLQPTCQVISKYLSNIRQHPFCLNFIPENCDLQEILLTDFSLLTHILRIFYEYCSKMKLPGANITLSFELFKFGKQSKQKSNPAFYIIKFKISSLIQSQYNLNQISESTQIELDSVKRAIKQLGPIEGYKWRKQQNQAGYKQIIITFSILQNIMNVPQRFQNALTLNDKRIKS